ncbi:peptidyl-prolyl cis-trans isomerase A (cyclophilin A)/peptidyl-prolyl cis-trans isomerase B (cyclophilin B) [Nitrosomonas sp. Nm51]|uniref:peptidylprolyl isomerase n=1 Tax=Nitrosomonas sp. Nm51 TaxID=133720 RepID=UPI0008B337CB|nr:peptidylprolyl isomerase [Nitrosomonas sp. Nm51]SEQ77456.1 peptidyl-prolyl cis-trans isomerase A (cyclophilin A)/peptidyl-prolyl cis-trans isomerase B (cyclophilin B) [Nitrosomonas sp. Nm51]
MRFTQFFAAVLFIFWNITGHAANPQVIIKTNFGPITLELYPEKAPKTVENFLRYVENGFYNNTIFHRVIPNFMIQGGGFDTAFNQKTTRGPIANEANNGLKNEIGTIAMARTSDPHSATAQFFINVANNTFLNYTAPNARGYGYTVFGEVTDGMNIVHQIAKTPTGSGGPFPGDVPRTIITIEDISVLTFEDNKKQQ